MRHISRTMKEHYESTFAQHGANYEGVDWGGGESGKQRLDLRYEMMARLIKESGTDEKIALLDVGCGYGGFCDYLQGREGLHRNISYAGIDLCENMVEYARGRHPECEFLLGDFLESNETQAYDYVICNGILTQKLANSIREMDRYARELIDKMWEAARRGIAFNIMKSQVDFVNENLYYKSPLEVLGYCMTLTDRFRIDCSYPLYEYTVYLYRKGEYWNKE